MRGPARAHGLALVAALALGAALGCYHDDYLLGAVCSRDSDCGADQCCSGVRCRPNTPEDCRLVGQVYPFFAAYAACDDAAPCLAHGQPVCARWAGAELGFCTDLCTGDPARNCELHVDGFPVRYTPRTCVEVDGQSVCAIDCSEEPTCPPEMQCHQGVCVPTAPAP